MQVGRRLAGPKEMVKLLRLCLDYGEKEVLKVIDCFGAAEFLSGPGVGPTNTSH